MLTSFLLLLTPYHLLSYAWFKKPLFLLLGMLSAFGTLLLLSSNEAWLLWSWLPEARRVPLDHIAQTGVQITTLFLIGHFLDLPSRAPIFFLLLKYLAVLYVLELLFCLIFIYQGGGAFSDSQFGRSLLLLFGSAVLLFCLWTPEQRIKLLWLTIICIPIVIAHSLVVWNPAFGLSSEVVIGLAAGWSLLLSAYSHKKHFDQCHLHTQVLEQRIESQKEHLNDYREAVNERTNELQVTLKSLEGQHRELVKTQAQLIQSGKMAALDQLIAGVAHEINTPLGIIRSTIKDSSLCIDHLLSKLPVLVQELSTEAFSAFVQLCERTPENRGLNSALMDTRRQAVKIGLAAQGIENSDDFVSLLVELGFTGIRKADLSLLCHPRHRLIFETAHQLISLRNNDRIVSVASDRASKVVAALRAYSIYQTNRQLVDSDLRENLEMIMTLYHNQFKQGIEIIRNYQATPIIACYPDELGQVWSNLIYNAMQAMNGKGTLTLSLKQQEGYAVVSISDTGPGIPPEIRRQIFEPFFTTKPMSEGTGLGLHIVRQIVEHHHGELSVESEVGLGCTFTVKLPLRRLNVE